MPWRSFRGREKQFAFAVVYMKNGRRRIFEDVYPDHQNKSKDPASPFTKPTLHCEEILLAQIDEFLQNNLDLVERIFIYSYNSPCLKREKHNNIDICPCMFLLLEKADEWQRKYGCVTEVAFTKFWGLRGPNVFKDLTYSNISSPCSPFYPYIEKCKKIPFKLDSKQFKNKFGELYKTISFVKDKEKLNKQIATSKEELVKLAETSKTRQEHLDHGHKIIESLQFDSQINICEILHKNWNEMVDNCPLPPSIIDEITTDFNINVVKRFLKLLQCTLGKCSPLQLYHHPPEYS